MKELNRKERWTLMHWRRKNGSTRVQVTVDAQSGTWWLHGIWNSRSCPVVHTYCTKSSLRWTTSKTSDDLRSCWCVQRAKGKLCSLILQKSDCSTGSTIAAKPSLRCWKIPQGNWKKDKATTNSCMKYDTLGFTGQSCWTFCQIKLKLVQDLGLCCVPLCRHLSENWMCLIELLLQLFLGLFSWFIYLFIL